MISFLHIALTLLASALYTTLIYYTAPNKTVTVQKMLIYLVSGVGSVFLLYGLWKLAPSYFEPNIRELMGYPTRDDIIFNAFWEVSLPEEFVKLLAFSITFYLLEIKRVFKCFKTKSLPIAIVIYSGLVGMGFGTYENVLYVLSKGIDVLPIRVITALLMHTMCGLIIGFAFAMARLHRFSKGATPYELLCKNSKMFNYLSKVGLAFIATYVIHAAYDLNLMLPSNSTGGVMITQLLLVIIVSYLCIKRVSKS